MKIIHDCFRYDRHGAIVPTRWYLKQLKKHDPLTYKMIMSYCKRVKSFQISKPKR